jgi:hypothetical protein
VRASSSGRHIRQKRWGGRGTGAVRATGFYEGSLTVEGTSGCHEPSPFTGRWSRQPWRLPHAGKRYGSQEPKLRRRREGAPGLAEEGEATEVSEARSVAGTVGRKRPRSEPPRRKRPARGFEARQRVSAAIRRSVHECRETLGTPVSRTEPKTPWGVHAMKVAERTGNARGTGARRSFRWQKLVGRVVRLVLREIARSRGEPGR